MASLMQQLKCGATIDFTNAIATTSASPKSTPILPASKDPDMINNLNPSGLKIKRVFLQHILFKIELQYSDFTSSCQSDIFSSDSSGSTSTFVFVQLNNTFDPLSAAGNVFPQPRGPSISLGPPDLLTTSEDITCILHSGSQLVRGIDIRGIKALDH